MPDNNNEVSIDKDAADLLDPTELAPRQVEPAKVIFVPMKDFEARVNNNVFHFRTDVPTEVTRDVAAMLLEDKTRGYVRT